MKKKSFLFAILFIAININLSAQSYWGVKAGIAVSELRDTDIEKSGGLSFAAVRNFHIYKGASIEIELDVTNKKANFGEVYAHWEYWCFLTKVNLNIFVIEIPVLLKYKFIVNNEISLSPYFGMGYSHYIGRGRQATRIKEVENVDCEYNFVNEGSSSTLVKSYNLGFSFYWNKRYWIDLRYSWDDRPIGYPNGFIVENKFHSLYMMLGIIF